ncbi:T9SS type A sorting domain-containing protein [Muricauda sp. SCSIO 64092]|uniref:LamG domain-containing protein n=1 Tax=Allomuricauda sp. SCSIO 64092 TaxID=2908842 RepID=UPI001FF43062|nr:LamG-like jellyroll fold domain-containing protein [Muricauda sp. SCSIO 64092]UOY06201.1 T9SS type A sorting domain-containing protein [Muricauda sp. SCSIO 64092]
MKKSIQSLCIFFLFSVVCVAQDYEGAKIVQASQAIHNNANNKKYTFQVGMPYLGQNKNLQSRKTNTSDFRFPWDILYLYNTFAEESFEVSKGYYTDHIQLNWELRNNADKVMNLKIYRRPFTEDNSAPYEFLSTLAADATEYTDNYVEGGVLYQYKVVATGLADAPILYETYIEGIGFRNPTAVVTGNISFEGGNPVENVTINAQPQGSIINYGSALNIPEDSYLIAKNINKPITTEATFQAWVKPNTDFQAQSQYLKLFQIDSGNDHILIAAYLAESSNQLLFYVGPAQINLSIGNLYHLNNYYPSGEINSRGDDVLIPVKEFDVRFSHVSVTIKDGEVPKLYVNGRPMTEAYSKQLNETLIATDSNYTAPYFGVSTQNSTHIMDMKSAQNTAWKNIEVGGVHTAIFDEIRVWNAVLGPDEIITDYRRYISGNEANLICYASANENAGNFAYDASRSGYTFNKNHLAIKDIYRDQGTSEPGWVDGAGNIPTASQLGILGVTDSNGNYEVSSIPYAGSGESFTITPSFGQHQFEPNQQLIYLGQGSEVANKIDFTDISSFVFKGKVSYNSKGVFPSFVEVNTGNANHPVFTGLTDGIEYVSGPGILDEGYNYYEKNGEKFSKGEYWLNDLGTSDPDDDYLEQYARIPSEGVNIYIDGQLVLDENNEPVVSDENGEFEISVPIGDHYISLKKDNHEFVYAGRFPEASGTTSEFFEDAQEQVVFIDNTKVEVVGRVVGGTTESSKAIGFGGAGTYETPVTDEFGQSATETVSSVNNIGVANITMGYTPVGGTATPYTRYHFNTNAETGEYRIAVLPLQYTIGQTGGISIPNNNSINLLKADEVLDYSKVPQVTTPEYTDSNGKIIEGTPFHYEKSFTYRSTPILRTTDQEYAKELVIDGKRISTSGFQYPVYRQFASYTITLDSFERYINYDGTEAVEDLVPIVDGEFIITNNLALANSETITVSEEIPSESYYTFKAGTPSVSSPFTKTMVIKYRVNGVDYPAENYIGEGIILGGQSDGSQTFITSAPDIPDIILRDPPGSNSSATIEKGQSITFTSEYTEDDDNTVSDNLTVMLGVKFAAGGGLAGPVIETETTNNATTGISLETNSALGKELTKTYTFTQTISTSDDNGFVGANADLYIGNSKNYVYGQYDNILATTSEPQIGDRFVLTNTDGDKVYINKQKAMYFVEEPSETFFVYTQKHILSHLIPDLQAIIANLDAGVISENDPGVQSRDFYEQQINLWRKTIRENERTKYLVTNDRDVIKEGLEDYLTKYKSDLQSTIDDADLGAGGHDLLTKKLDEADGIEDQIKDHFEQNITFDSGVGEITRTIESSIITSKFNEFELNVEESLGGQVGFNILKTGVLDEVEDVVDEDLDGSFSSEDESTITVSYTFADENPEDAFSVDIVNAFDGNGVIFSTVGGSSSCPWEGGEESYFFNPSTYNADATDIPELEESQRVALSAATQKVENPKISVVDNNVSGVLEGRNAEFDLILENLSEIEAQGDDNPDTIMFYLAVENTSNPNNAIINIDPNGTPVYVPYGEKVHYTLTMAKGSADVYDYNDIVISIESACDDDMSDSVSLSASFVPSCSEVVVSAPLDNWVYNKEMAFNVDGTTNNLPVELIGFNTAFNSFQKIDLEYRLATSSTWTRAHTYYGTQADYDIAVSDGETGISLITGSTINFDLDIIGLNLQDGVYEIRGRSTCTDGTEFISEEVRGTIDLNAPVRFGSPSPTDGILSTGDDMLVTFNEPVSFNPAVSVIQIKGETNQLPVNHNVSVRFEGMNNTMTTSDPFTSSGDFTIEFWMKNETTGNATMMNQNHGFNITLKQNNMTFNVLDISVNASIASDGNFHHYVITHNANAGSIEIFEDDRVIGSGLGTPGGQYNNSSDLVIGGNNFIGNLHDLRIWSHSMTLADAYANMYEKLEGNEQGLIGFWPMDEGRGTLAKDLARFKHGVLTADWDIFPKSESYEFNGTQYMELDNVSYVQITNTMDATLSFWVKTDVSEAGTIFSNGIGDDSDPVQTGGYRNKWSVDMDANGQLSFASEGAAYTLTSTGIADNQWHHVTILFNRLGALDTYVDEALVSTNQIGNIGGLSGNKVWIGARGTIDLAGKTTVDNIFNGKIDELRLWNTRRTVDQVIRDSHHELDPESIGLLLYARMNAPDIATGNGPKYYHLYTNQSVIQSAAILNNGTANYSNDAPAIQPERELIKFQVSHTLNGNQMVLEPVVTDWAVVEGQVLDITVHRMFDEANNMQESPITWTAFIDKNDVSWYMEGVSDQDEILKAQGEEKSLSIILVNRGGTTENFEITNVPSWLTLSETADVIQPNSTHKITAVIDDDLASGEYAHNLFLVTDYSYDQKVYLNLRVLADGPDWTVNPEDYNYSSNFIGKIKIDGALSSDKYDKVAAFSGDEVRGVANLEYDTNYQSYFAYLTVHSNTNNGDKITFKIWDASADLIIEATVDGNDSMIFADGDIMGSLSGPVIFEDTTIIEQEIPFNKGWTWISFNVSDTRFSDLNTLTSEMTLTTSDRILTHTPSYVDIYNLDAVNPGLSTWDGTISGNGGLSIYKMYKVELEQAQTLIISGERVDISNWVFPVKENWNWLPYPISRDNAINDALANLQANDGDVIKSQDLFAMYDPLNGWKGSLHYLQSGHGYMLKSSKEQAFRYPEYLAANSGKKASKSKASKIGTAYARFAENMNFVIEFPFLYNKVTVYDSHGNPRGSANSVEIDGRNLAFLTAHAEGKETLHFLLGDDRQEFNTNVEYAFVPDAVEGTFSNPMRLDIHGNQDIDTVLQPILHPNPFERELLIDVVALKSQSVSISIFDMGYKKVFSTQVEVQEGKGQLNLTPKISSGAYLVEIALDGVVYSKKIIKH